MKLFLLFCCCFIASDLLAQSTKSFEPDLLRSFKKIAYWRDNQYSDTTGTLVDSLANANNVFAKKLKHYSEKFPLSITNSFDSLKEYLYISTSADGLFRIYSWDTWTGGTMHFFENVMQYKSGTITKAIIDTPKEEGDSRPNYYKMYTFKANGKSCYLAVYLFIGSSIDIAEGIHIYTIEKGKLVDVKLIKTHSGLHGDLSYEVQTNSYDRPRIHFDSATKTVYLPLVDEDNNFTSKFIQYKFTGQYFERVGN